MKALRIITAGFTLSCLILAITDANFPAICGWFVASLHVFEKAIFYKK